MNDIIRELSDGPYVVVPVGSRRTCDPAPTDTDDDYLVLCEKTGETVKNLKQWGFEPPEDIEEYIKLHSCSFISLRFGDLNLIVTDDPKWFAKFLSASYFAKKYNVMDKKDRIEMFDAIVIGDDFSTEFAGEWFRLAAKNIPAFEGQKFTSEMADFYPIKRIKDAHPKG